MPTRNASVEPALTAPPRPHETATEVPLADALQHLGINSLTDYSIRWTQIEPYQARWSIGHDCNATATAFTMDAHTGLLQRAFLREDFQDEVATGCSDGNASP